MLPALHAAWGVRPETDLSTVRGLTDAAEAWQRGGEAPRQLGGALAAMARQVAALLEESRRDLDGALDGPEAILDPARRIVAGYEATLAALEALGAAVERADRAAGAEPLGSLERAAAAVREQQARIQEWLEAAGARCARCAGTGASDLCPTCGLDLLVPDPAFLQDTSHRTAVLPAAYVAVFEAWRAVHQGQGTLQELAARLDALEETVARQVSMAEACAGEESLPSIRPLLGCLEDVRKGASRMRSAWETRRMADLNAGWDLVFEGACRLEGLASALRREAGGHGEDRPGVDLVDLS